MAVHSGRRRSAAERATTTMMTTAGAARPERRRDRAASVRISVSAPLRSRARARELERRARESRRSPEAAVRSAAAARIQSPRAPAPVRQVPARPAKQAPDSAQCHPTPERHRRSSAGAGGAARASRTRSRALRRAPRPAADWRAAARWRQAREAPERAWPQAAWRPRRRLQVVVSGGASGNSLRSCEPEADEINGRRKQKDIAADVSGSNSRRFHSAVTPDGSAFSLRDCRGQAPRPGRSHRRISRRDCRLTARFLRRRTGRPRAAFILVSPDARKSFMSEVAAAARTPCGLQRRLVRPIISP